MMFENCLPPIPENPFTKLEGIYKIPISISTTEFLNPSRNYFTYDVRHQFDNLVAVIDFYRKQKPKASLHSILKLLNVPDSALAKIPTDIQEDEVIEYWEVTTKEADIKKMGISRHFTSCYNGGFQPMQIIQAATGTGLALVRKLDKDGNLLSRFLITGDKDVGEGKFGAVGRIRASNYKSPTGIDTTFVLKVFESLNSDKCTKLEGEELASFRWK